mmetsp:Transcript_12595/g.15637  ORF Transcript_12595/g.15637 Transcript_12595/m.15637 type:complete len:404 (+) Transcript_12595:146-1357(+)|eukprot:CAMPEP_0204830286 /NCGR_PEP_ID=MMETSP1346-20131115/8440_1 /ASSEMBLY_ACC=CAM_ASM_000771 /TAXON_ID=215587 /ORGANISM="Aplanochytrium stocchinoi, Strain GSBS06" /LENGTH=403 /DNA_ID=CAMNT_0051960453 /DNA_START=339 /DNA_END=1550 /DNA_ORIENTATION=+
MATKNVQEPERSQEAEGSTADLTPSTPLVKKAESNSSTGMTPVKALGAVLTGIAFGFAIDRANLNVPYAIIQQLDMKNFTMLRMFLGASAASTVAITSCHLLGVYERVPKPRVVLGFNLMHGYGGNVVGGLLLGIGMALSGACPGTIFPQIGAYPGLRTGLIVLGGITGTITFGYLENRISALHEDFLCSRPDPKKGKENLLNALAIGSVVAVAGVIYALDQQFPWQEEMNKIIRDDVSTASSLAVLDPLVAGLIVGACQIPSIIFSGGSFGMSSGWVLPSFYIARLFDSNVSENAPYMKKYLSSIFANWQILSAAGAVIGAYISSYALPSAGLSSDALAIQQSFGASQFIGGFLLLFGARLGGGCTSGHGLSGLGLISTSSAVNVAFMFIGGMLTRAAINLL